MDNELHLTKEEWHDLDARADNEGTHYLIVFHGGAQSLIDKDPALHEAAEAVQKAWQQWEAVEQKYKDAYGEYWDV